MTATSGTHADTLTLLSYTQLTEALTASNDEYETRFAAFLHAAQRAREIAALNLTGLAEAKAEMDGHWAGCKAQAAMTKALAAEITARIARRDYA